MTTLSVPSTQDYRGQSLASNIDTIDFTGTGFIKATFQPSQFGGSGISNSVMLGNASSTPSPGNGYVVEVDLTSSDASFSAQSWGFGSLNVNDPPPQALIVGSSGAQTITGGDLIPTVIVAGTGVDTLLGGVAGTAFVFAPGNVPQGDVIDGGSGNRAVAEIDVAGGSVDYTGATISNVGTIVFDAAGGTATFTGDQLASAGVTQISDLTTIGGFNPGGHETLVVHGSNVNLSGLTFTGWASSDRVIVDGTPGSNVIVGANGVNNTIDGGSGNETLTGGDRGNTFVFDSHLSKHAKVDHITNFVHGKDTIALSHHIFGPHLEVNPHTFYAAPHAHHAADADDHVIYDKATGALYVEKSLHSPPIEVAVLDHHPHINSHDFLLVP